MTHYNPKKKSNFLSLEDPALQNLHDSKNLVDEVVLRVYLQEFLIAVSSSSKEIGLIISSLAAGKKKKDICLGKKLEKTQRYARIDKAIATARKMWED